MHRRHFYWDLHHGKRRDCVLSCRGRQEVDQDIVVEPRLRHHNRGPQCGGMYVDNSAPCASPESCVFRCWPFVPPLPPADCIMRVRLGRFHARPLQARGQATARTASSRIRSSTALLAETGCIVSTLRTGRTCTCTPITAMWTTSGRGARVRKLAPPEESLPTLVRIWTHRSSPATRISN